MSNFEDTFLGIIVGAIIGHAIGLLLIGFFRDEIFAWLDNMRGKVRRLFGLEN